jgi:hypothetical protein
MLGLPSIHHQEVEKTRLPSIGKVGNIMREGKDSKFKEKSMPSVTRVKLDKCPR